MNILNIKNLNILVYLYKIFEQFYDGINNLFIIILYLAKNELKEIAIA